MCGDEEREGGRRVAVLRVEEGSALPPAAIGEGAPASLEPAPESFRERVVGRVHAGEEGVAPLTGDGERVELGGLEGRVVVGAVLTPALGAPAFDGHVERGVWAELVHA